MADNPSRSLKGIIFDISKLTGATAAGQFVALCAAPIITRLYDPSDFGIFSLATAAIGLYLPMAALRYEMALVLPPVEGDAKKLAALCLYLVLFFTLLFSVLAGILTLLTDIPYLGFVPVVALVVGVHTVMTNWLVRGRDIHHLSILKFVTVVSIVISQVVFSFIYGGFVGLLLGYTIGHFIGILITLRRWSEIPRFYSLQEVKQVAMEYRAFAQFSSPAGVLNTLGVESTRLVLPFLYGASLAGQVNLAERICGLPFQLIGLAVNQVFWSDAANLYNNEPDRLWKLFVNINAMLFVGMIPGLILTVYGSEIFKFLFGDAWGQAGEFAGVIVLGQLIALPAFASNGLHCYRLNHIMSAWDISRLFLVTLVFTSAWYFSLSAMTCIILFTSVYGVMSLIIIGINAIVILRKRGETMICQTCNRTRYIIQNHNNRPIIVPCPDCHNGDQSCCDGAMPDNCDLIPEPARAIPMQLVTQLQQAIRK